MVNPDNTINSRLRPIKGQEKSSDRPEGAVNKDKFEEVYGVYERKKTKEEKAKEWDDVKNVKKQLEGSEVVVNKPVSLFDLAKEGKKEESGEESHETPKKGLFDLAKAEPHPTVPTPVVVQAEKVIAAPEPPRADQMRMQKIIDEIVKHVYQLETKGEVSTVIVLDDKKGVFKGVSIKISELDTSKGQLNITIDNLTPEAKVLVERHETLLLEALEKKGYQVQQFIATSSLENPRLETASRSEPEKRDSRGSHPGKEQGSQEQDEEE